MPKSGTLSKARIIKAVIETNEYTQQKAHETIEILLELIKRSLESGHDILISGFGKFCVKKKRRGKGRNPVTATAMMLRHRNVVTCECFGTLREKINDHQY